MSQTETRTTPDGTSLLHRTWTADGSRRGTVILVHGLAEHSGRYEHVGAHLAAAGYEVVAQDLHGHGRSGGDRTHIESFDVYREDLVPLVEEGRRHGTVILLGHSAGGLIATDYVLGDHPAPDLLILSAPFYDAEYPSYKRWIARFLPRLLPRLRIPLGLKPEQLARDPAVGEAYLADPLVAPNATAKLGSEFLATQKRVRSALRDFGIPTLVIHGGSDPIVPPEITAPLAAFPSVERHLFPSFRHESFNEDGGAEALALVTSWLDRQLAAAA